jgi:hypothetical protein
VLTKCVAGSLYAKPEIVKHGELFRSLLKNDIGVQPLLLEIHRLQASQSWKEPISVDNLDREVTTIATALQAAMQAQGNTDPTKAFDHGRQYLKYLAELCDVYAGTPTLHAVQDAVITRVLTQDKESLLAVSSLQADSNSASQPVSVEAPILVNFPDVVDNTGDKREELTLQSLLSGSVKRVAVQTEGEQAGHKAMIEHQQLLDLARGVSSTDPVALEHCVDGERKWHAGRYEDARIAFEQVLTDGKGDTEPLEILSRFAKFGKYCTKQCLDARALLEKGKTCRERFEYAKASEHFEKAGKILTKHHELYGRTEHVAPATVLVIRLETEKKALALCEERLRRAQRGYFMQQIALLASAFGGGSMRLWGLRQKASQLVTNAGGGLKALDVNGSLSLRLLYSILKTIAPTNDDALILSPANSFYQDATSPDHYHCGVLILVRRLFVCSSGRDQTMIHPARWNHILRTLEQFLKKATSTDDAANVCRPDNSSKLFVSTCKLICAMHVHRDSSLKRRHVTGDRRVQVAAVSSVGNGLHMCTGDQQLLELSDFALQQLHDLPERGNRKCVKLRALAFELARDMHEELLRCDLNRWVNARSLPSVNNEAHGKIRSIDNPERQSQDDSWDCKVYAVTSKRHMEGRATVRFKGDQLLCKYAKATLQLALGDSCGACSLECR